MPTMFSVVPSPPPPPPPHLSFPLNKISPPVSTPLFSTSRLTHQQAVLVCLCSSLTSSTSTSSIGETSSPQASSVLSPLESDAEAENLDVLPINGCKACGRSEIEQGCNAEGRIQGGIATIPGFGWWPIKAYRPCPGFIASGGRYKRRGQSMDEVVSGSGKARDPLSTFDGESTSRNKGKGGKRFKS